MRIYLIIFVLLIVGCSTLIKNEEDLVNSVVMRTGTSDCPSCAQYKRVITSTFKVGSSPQPRDERGQLLNGVLTPWIALGITNRGWAIDPRDAQFSFPSPSIYQNNIYLASLSSKKDDRWRFFIYIRQNGDPYIGNNIYHKYRTYLLVGDEYVPIPINYTTNEKIFSGCSVNFGCSWDEEYMIPTSAIFNLINEKGPLRLFFRYEDVKANSSPKKIKSNFVSESDGLIVDIKKEYVISFLNRARLEIEK